MLKQNLLATAVLSVTMGLLSVSSANASEAASANSAAAAPAPNVLSQLCLPQEFGGVADGKTLNTKAIQSAIDKCAALGGGEVRLSKGMWRSGPLELKSNIILNVTADATLKADNREGDFVAAYIGCETQPREAFLLANNASNVMITGSGTIDGNGAESWWPEALEVRKAVRSGDTKLFEERFPGVKLANGMPRPWLIELNNVTGAMVYGVNIQNSPMWNIVIRNSSEVGVNGVKITTPTDSPNTDGIDIVSSKRVHVENVEIFTGDDNIAIKSGVDQGTAGPSEDILIENSIMHAGHGISIGSETANGIGKVTVQNTSFDNTENGIRIKSARDRGNKIGPLHVHDVTMENVATPILVTFSYAGHAGADGLGLVEPLERMDVTATTPQVNGVMIDGLTATGANIAALLSGLPESIVHGVVLKDINIESNLGIQARYVDGSIIRARINSKDGKPIVRGPDAMLREAR